jgi:septal ring factor EnvC (AmiA/AmiB activator)
VHVLTKVFVVIAAVLSVALSVLVVAFAVNTDRIREDYQNIVSAKAAVEAQSSAAVTIAKEENTRLHSANEQLERDQVTIKTNLNNLENERNSLSAAKTKAELERDAITSKIAELGETAKTQATLITSYRDEVTTLRKAELDFRQRALDMDNRLNDLESQREVLQQNFRALQEQLAEAKRAANGQPAAGIVSGAAEQAFVYSGPRIQGRVEEIKTDPSNGKTLVKLSVGTNDKIAKNMKLFIVRGDQFIANVIVSQPDMKWSVAEVQLLNKGATISVGDAALSKID